MPDNESDIGMQITLEISEDIARQFAVDPETLSRAALEALAIEGARSAKLTTEQVRRLLGLATRYEADGFLKQHEVYYPFTREQIHSDAAIALELSKQCLSSQIPRR